MQQILFSRHLPEQQVIMEREERGLEITGFKLGVQGGMTDLMITSKCKDAGTWNSISICDSIS